MILWDTNPWSNFCDPHWKVICRNKCFWLAYERMFFFIAWVLVIFYLIRFAFMNTWKIPDKLNFESLRKFKLIPLYFQVFNCLHSYILSSLSSKYMYLIQVYSYMIRSCCNYLRICEGGLNCWKDVLVDIHLKNIER